MAQLSPLLHREMYCNGERCPTQNLLALLVERRAWRPASPGGADECVRRYVGVFDCGMLLLVTISPCASSFLNTLAGLVRSGHL